jgi:hypothetical protein
MLLGFRPSPLDENGRRLDEVGDWKVIELPRGEPKQIVFDA